MSARPSSALSSSARVANVGSKIRLFLFSSCSLPANSTGLKIRKLVMQPAKMHLNSTTRQPQSTNKALLSTAAWQQQQQQQQQQHIATWVMDIIDT